jgi:outer membrane protein insertion porin family
MLAYGAEEHSSKQSLKGSVSVEKANLFGLGYDIGGLVQGDRHHLRRLEFHFFDPHILDTNFSGGYYLYKRWDEYERWSHLDKEPIQKVLGVDLRFGVPVYVINKYTNLILDLCVEDIHCSNIKIDERYKDALGPIVRRNFQNGTLKCIGLDLVQDTRNHPIYPSSGYKVTLGTKMAPAGINRQFDFFKTEIEGSCYTALIGKDSLVLGLRAKAGRIFTLDNKKNIPYKELYHIGGQATVRGFTWSGIGPAWQWGEPLGSRNALLFSTELTFPLIEDYSIKGHVFYDSGAGWDTPKKDIINTEGIRQNSFNLRHSVGFGLNLIKPIPAKIDWGFKLDRKKGETPHEFHLSMNYAW